MIIKDLSTGCGDLLLTAFYPTDEKGRYLKKEDGLPWYPSPKESCDWLDSFLKGERTEFGYQFQGRAFVIAILNPNQEKAFGHVFERNGFEIISEGVNDNHNHVLTLRAKVNKKDGKRIELWHAEKATWFQNWFKPIQAIVEKVTKKNDASGRTGKVLQRKVAVSASE